MLNQLGGISFYITNVCNFNCHNCSYLNNYPVKGHQLWKDNKESCKQWATKINPAFITILGGEPMSNPDFLKWVHGIANIWPEAEVRINTNGSYFDRWPTLYDELLPYRGRVNISISGHNENNRIQEIKKAKSYLRGNISQYKNKQKMLQVWVWKKIYNNIKDPSWPDVNTIEEYYNLPDHIQKEIVEIHNIDINDRILDDEPVEDYEVYIDENGMRVGWARWDEFRTSAIKFNPSTQSMTLHNSDPEKAVNICHGGKCAYIKDGKFYKCQVMGILPDMIDQNFPLDISEEDKNLILSYQPATVDWSEGELAEFISGCQNGDSIPQCKFCPEVMLQTKIYATTDKIKIIKRKSQ